MKLKPHNPGVFYGQCSEICGAYHKFIPISLEFVSNDYDPDDSGYESSGRDIRTDSSWYSDWDVDRDRESGLDL